VGSITEEGKSDILPRRGKIIDTLRRNKPHQSRVADIEDSNQTNLRGISRPSEDIESDGIRETVLVDMFDSSRMSRCSRLLWVARYSFANIFCTFDVLYT
jgi:hypothetical protein